MKARIFHLFCYPPSEVISSRKCPVRKPNPSSPQAPKPIAVRADGTLDVPDRPIIPFIEGDGTGPDIWRASVRVLDAAVSQGIRRQEEDRVDRGLRGREGQGAVRHLAARRDAGGVQDLLRRHQGPADDAGRRRHPLAQRRDPPDAGPLRLSAPGALLQGRPVAGEGTREGRHGDLPREHGGHLRRHRVGRRVARGEEGHRVPAERDGREEDPLPGDVGHRHQAGVARGHRAADSRRARLRHPAQAQERHAGAQGQHHEVHRGRVPRLGLRPGQARIRRARRRLGRLRRQAAGRPAAGQGLDRRHHAAAGADPPRRVRRHRDVEPERRLPQSTRWPRRWAASASRRAATSTT